MGYNVIVLQRSHMNRKTFGQYIRSITTPDGDIRHIVAVYDMEYKAHFYDLTPEWYPNHVRVPTDWPSYSTRRQALRHARYLCSKGGRRGDRYIEFDAI